MKTSSQREEKVSRCNDKQLASNKATLSDAIAQVNEEYAAISSSDLPLTIRRTNAITCQLTPQPALPLK